MDAIVLVGGLGTRLRPLTYTRHKSLVPLCNQPAIEYLFNWLAESGVGRVVLAIGQHNEDLEAAYPDGEWNGLRIVQVPEHTRLESGGAIRNAIREAGVEGRFLVLNGDIYAEFDLKVALAAHEEQRAELTMALYPVDDPSPFGVAALSDDGLISGFVEKPPPGTAPSNLINAGVWIFEPGIVAEIPDGAVRVEETLFPSLVARGRRVLGFEFQGLWADIGTPQRYLDVGVALATRSDMPSVHAEASVSVAATVSSSSIGAGTTLRGGASVEQSILWEGVTVGRNAQVRSSVIADGVDIGDGAILDGVVSGTGASFPPGAVVPSGTVVEPNCGWQAID